MLVIIATGMADLALVSLHKLPLAVSYYSGEGNLKTPQKQHKLSEQETSKWHPRSCLTQLLAVNWEKRLAVECRLVEQLCPHIVNVLEGLPGANVKKYGDLTLGKSVFVRYVIVHFGLQAYSRTEIILK